MFNFKNSFDEFKEEDKKDNRFFENDNSSQKLTTVEIKKIKEEGLTTKEIIETLVENSSTFDQKTVYSQEKYLKKKQEKYSNFIRIYKPNAATLCDMWFSQCSQKTSHLRIDSLAHILNISNVRSGSKFIVVDTYNGLVTAAVLERLLGDCSVLNKLNEVNNGQQSSTNRINDVGKCVQVYLEEGPVSTWRQAISALNYKEEHLDGCLFNAQIHRTVPILKPEIKVKKINYKPERFEEQDNQEATEDKDLNDQDVQNHDLNQKRKLEEDEDIEFQKIKRLKFEGRNERRKKRLEEEAVALELLSKRNFDGLIVIAKNHKVFEIVDHLIEFLGPSAQFVVFSNFCEPLIECYSKIKHKVCNIKLNDIWMREYQVLPMRTRPNMEMYGKSGFILHGITLKRN